MASLPLNSTLLTSHAGTTNEGFASLQSLLSPGIRSVLVKGDPGAGKTILAFELLRLHGKGVYVSTRVPEEKALEQYPGARALFKQGKLALAKPQTSGTKFEDARLGTMPLLIESVLESISKMKDPLIVLDSWDTISKSLELIESMKAESTLMALADAKKARLVFISEEPELTSTDYSVDAIVVLKDERLDGRRIRRIEWRKLRGLDIPRSASLFSLYDARFNVFQPLNMPEPEIAYEPKPFRPIKNTSKYYSTGSVDLDVMLGGGLRRGSMNVLELGRHLNPIWHSPLMVAISCNFIANGGCYIAMPVAGVTPKLIKEARLRHLPKQVVESSLRVGDYGGADSKDPCFFKLDTESQSKGFEIFRRVQEELAVVGDRRRPVLTTLGIDAVELIIGEGVRNLLVRGAQITERYGDTSVLLVRHSTDIRDVLADAADVYLKADIIDGAVTLYSLKPPSRIYHFAYDYSKGYPSVKLTPMA